MGVSMKSGKPQGIGGGVTLILMAACLFAASDATIKHLGTTLPVLVLMWTRYLFQAITLGAWHYLRKHTFRIASKVPRLQFLRGLILLGNSTTSFYGIQQVPLAEFTALVLLAPLATTVLSAVVLKERVSLSRWAMVILGAAGMLAVVRPGDSAAIGWGALLPIASALCYAAFQLLTHRIVASDDLVVTNLLSASVVTVAIGVILWSAPLDIAPVLSGATVQQWGLLFLLGILATCGQVSMSSAVCAAPASVLMPFAYAQIGFAAAIGWLVFDHAPDIGSIAGMCLIGLGGIGTVWLNGRK